MASNDIQSVVSKLNRFNKNELVEIIVHRKVPDSLADSHLLKYIAAKTCGKCGENSAGNEFFADALDTPTDSGCHLFPCIRLRAELDAKQSESLTLNKLIFQLEGRTRDQELIIELLKTPNNLKYDSIQQGPKPISVSAGNNNPQIATTVSTSKLPALSRPKNAQTCASKQKININQNNVGQVPASHKRKVFTNSQVGKDIDSAMASISTNTDRSVNNNRHINNNNNNKHNKPLIGTGQLTDSRGLIRTVTKMGYLHAYRFHPDTIAEDLQEHLRISIPDVDFKCEVWNKKETGASFKIAFPIKDVNKVYDTSIWPEGIAVRRFRFHRKNFQAAPLGQTTQ